MVARKKPAKRIEESQIPNEEILENKSPPVVHQVVEVINLDDSNSDETIKIEVEKKSRSKNDLPQNENTDSVEFEEVSEVTSREPDKETVEEPVVQKSDPGYQKSTSPVEQPQSESSQVVEDIFTKKDNLMEIGVTKKSSKQSIFIWAVVMIVAAITVGGGLLLFSNKSGIPSISLISKPTSTPIPTAEPTQAPKPALNREDVSIEVLNGGGVVGAASKMKTFLEEKGYTVDNVGNTDEYNYDLTEILVKENNDSLFKLLESDLEEEYNLATSASILDEDSDFDAQIIVGKE